MQDRPFHENTHTVYDTRKYEVSIMGESEQPWKFQGGGWCACLRETLYKGNDVQFCPREEGFHHDSGPYGFLPILNSGSIDGLHYLMMMMIRK